MSDLVKIAPFLKPYKYFIALNFIFNLLSVIFSLFSISLIIPVLGILFGTIEFDSEEVEKLLTLSVFSFEYFKIWLYNLIYNLIITKSEIYALGVICFFVIVFSLLKNIFFKLKSINDSMPKIFASPTFPLSVLTLPSFINFCTKPILSL